ncbi:unnamed protein product, partial [Choristocarpus tenellus]
MKSFTRNLGKAVGRLTGVKGTRKDSETMLQTPPSGGSGAMPPPPPAIETELKEGNESVGVDTMPQSPMRKRQAIMNNPEEFESMDVDEDDAGLSTVPKSDETQVFLSQALREHFLFSQMRDSEVLACVGVMKPHDCLAGEVIVRQGDRGTHFYVLETGFAE